MILRATSHFLILAFAIFTVTSVFSQQTIAVWTFENNPLSGSNNNPLPETGTGTASIVGSMGSPDRGTGSTTGCSQVSNTGAWQIGSATPGNNESSGVQFNVSTIGYNDIVLSYDHRISNTGSRTSRIQYTLDGSTWINLNVSATNYNSGCANRGAIDDGRIDVSSPVGNNVSDGWGRRTINFSGISGVNNNPNFGVRIVAAHYASTGQFRQANNVNTAATGGTWRFDNVSFTGTPRSCVMITEYMYSGNSGEFIELTNVCQTPVDLEGWSFDDDSRIPGSFDLSGAEILAPGESLIITESAAAAFRTAWDLCENQKVLGGLTNNLGRNDEINIFNQNGELMDRLTYGDQSFPGTIRTQNASGWVSASGLGNNDPSAWTLSVTGDTEESWASSDGDIGNPGKSKRAEIPFDPCESGPCVRITEYMYSGNNGEFIEFTNVCNDPVDMTNWSFDDDSRIPGTQDLSAFGVIQPGESVLLTESGSSDFRMAWNLCSEVKVIGNLSANLGRNDEINLFDQNGELADRLTYGDQNFPASVRTQNASGWVSVSGLGNNDPYEWTLSTVGDSEFSYTSVGGDIGNPGKSTLALQSYDPCQEEGPCAEILEINVENESCESAQDGSITLLVQSDFSLEFSINNGPFQPNPVFENLSARMYNMTIRALEDPACILETSVMVRNSGLTVILESGELNISPLAQISLGNTEIVVFDPESKRVFSTNGTDNRVDIIDLTDPQSPAIIGQVPVSGNINSVAVKNGVVAIAVAQGTLPGHVWLCNTNGEALLPSGIEVGYLPDMVVFTPDGLKILTANEGEPSADYSLDPEGSISIIDISQGVSNYTVSTADFSAYIGQEQNLRDQGIRIFGPGANAAQDLEPEYIAISEDGLFAYVSLQENNAMAVVNIATATVTGIFPLGYKDHSLPRNAFDPSDRDGGIQINTWPVFGMYQPDAIGCITLGGITYIVTANEGDARVYPMEGPAEGSSFSEEARISQLVLDPASFSGIPVLQSASGIGRLRVTTTLGDSDGDNKYEELFSYGGRSFSIWNADDMAQVYDSGSDFERITAIQLPSLYNSELGLTAEFDQRSDNKGPEPEALELFQHGGQVYAAIGLERTGGFLVYNITNPQSPHFVRYVFPFAGDAAPEDICFISANESPNQKPLLVVANEASGTMSVYEISTSCSTEILLNANIQGGAGIYHEHSWQIVGGTANGAVIMSPQEQQTILDFSSLSASGDVLIQYSVTDNTGCSISQTMLIQLEKAELAVSGNSNIVAHGSNLPSYSNFTNFGSALANQFVSRTFFLKNTGCTPLQLTTPYVEFSGPQATNFEVLSLPTEAILPGDSAAIVIRFSGNTFGIYDATAHLYSNDQLKPEFVFALQAAVSPAIIQVRGNGITIPNGDPTPAASDFSDFGTIAWNSNRSRTFAIFNLGTQNLILDASPRVIISGPHAQYFSLITAPPGVITPGQNRQFTIRFNATEPGQFNAVVEIPNNDIGGNPYTFAISANVNFPEMVVLGNTIAIETGDDTPWVADNTDFGVRALNSNTTLNYYVRNNGNGHLGLTGSPRVEIMGNGAPMFTVTTMPALSIAPGFSSLLRIRYTPTSTGIHQATVTIPNIDPDKNPYTFSIKGSTPGAMPFSPQINSGTSEKQTLTVFPNPASSQINILSVGLPMESQKLAEIMDFSGKCIHRFLLSYEMTPVDVSGFMPGIYIIKVVGYPGLNQSFIIQR